MQSDFRVVNQAGSLPLISKQICRRRAEDRRALFQPESPTFQVHGMFRLGVIKLLLYLSRGFLLHEFLA